ncbi:hypothetical protein [Salinivibrio phage CW02]|uniref:Uncharacterized protein n=1 Tax=Salinivibrio phage CW02 TaxID=1161935 RepID=H9D1G6_9CAUD|nr:hypothetical protein F490_gp29 [Salinivibrio phage CW02]AFE86208.1 hypothetical protein [Salinivibrio phage CW02]
MCNPNIVKTWGTEDWTVEVEEYEGIYYLHSTVYDNYKSSIKELRELWESDVKPYGESLGLEEFFSYTENTKFMDIMKVPSHIFKEPETGLEVYEWELR